MYRDTACKMSHVCGASMRCRRSCAGLLTARRTAVTARTGVTTICCDYLTVAALPSNQGVSDSHRSSVRHAFDPPTQTEHEDVRMHASQLTGCTYTLHIHCATDDCSSTATPGLPCRYISANWSTAGPRCLQQHASRRASCAPQCCAHDEKHTPISDSNPGPTPQLSTTRW